MYWHSNSVSFYEFPPFRILLEVLRIRLPLNVGSSAGIQRMLTHIHILL